MRVYTSDGYILGIRCDRGHSGNRRFTLAQRGWAACVGCGHFVSVDSLPQFVDRRTAVRMDRAEAVPQWPWDTAAAVLAARQGRARAN